ncbi:phosphohydrolase [Sphingomonas parva]|uniref:Phosphohydrolase n=1 Tax=Sphingomonas parva TaxID=2555898 RepID=A0A4Y8ZLF2_9SPHN|nr:metallophosphoesterase [Sphingomonas parva]TFI56831.1 phosphohydrolase [Sphingomonas parva]
MRPLPLALIGLVVAGLALAGWSYATAVADPVVRRARISLPGLSAGKPLKLILMSDLHVAGPDMPPERLARIVSQVNALEPDLVLIAGDFIGDRTLATRHYTSAESVAPLAALRPRLGTLAVLGNHDHWRDAAEVSAALAHVGVQLLDNDAARAGPLAIGGLDDDFTGHDDRPRTLARIEAIGGVPLLLSHSPDPFPNVPDSVALMVAGHTHCGQIRLPLIGAVATDSAYGQRYACGLVRERGKILVVSAGLGTSVLPLRLGAVPDLWLLTLAADPLRR